MQGKAAKAEGESGEQLMREQSSPSAPSKAVTTNQKFCTVAIEMHAHYPAA